MMGMMKAVTVVYQHISCQIIINDGKRIQFEKIRRTMVGLKRVGSLIDARKAFGDHAVKRIRGS